MIYEGLEIESVEVHKVLSTKSALRVQTLPRNLLRGSQSAVPATKLALQDSDRAALPRRFAARALPDLNTQLSRDFPRLRKTTHMSCGLNVLYPGTKQGHAYAASYALLTRAQVCLRMSCSKVTTHYTCHEIRARRRSPPCPKGYTCHELCISK